MAGKRRATSELNRDNWDKDEPAEESGVYTKASEELLKKRVFKTAKRRITKPPEEGSMSAFNPASLANLTSKSHQPANQLFSFLSDMKPDASKTNGMSTKPNDQGDGKSESFSLFTFGNAMGKTENSSPFGNTAKKNEEKSSPMFSFGGTNSKVDDKVTTSVPSFRFGDIGDPLFNQGNKKDETTIQNEKTSENIDHYYAKLKGLNESVAKWISKHVEDNPLINLQPIFKDYEKFFDEIEKEYHKSDNVGSDGKNESKICATIIKQPETEVTTTPSDSFKFSSSSIEKNVSSNKIDLPATSIFKFGNTVASSDKNPSEKVESSTPSTLFKFGATNTSFNVSTSKTEQSSFKFDTSTVSDVPNTITQPKYSFGGSGSGFSSLQGFTSNPILSTPSTINFGSIPSSTSNNEENKDEEESEEPPKVEVKEVEEEGQIYTIRCKLFVKKDGTFVEKGVGNLFLKPVPESDKIQVIVRAHNSLANVLCNFILSKSIPTQRMGKNNVMIVCIPTPESKPPPIPVLIKVKTGEDADQLLETLEKHKK
ncbi:nuclear pore complex protein Nup50 [Coccinella septempunctata]|uniref:nuclear pore complex protein Nup50 n=1 Tax=Coccinella septempunctata TaxID=41139 RepID=UPI001D07D960|nr:nuclear pore complex protein Nup50 [Coccinella septempunctata]